MAIRTMGGGSYGTFTSEAKPTSTYRAITGGPDVGDLVIVQGSGNLSYAVNTCAANGALVPGAHPVGIIREVNNLSNVVTVEWINVRGVLTLRYTGTATVGLGVVAATTTPNSKVSCIATLANTSAPRPFVVAIDTPESGYLQAFLLG